MIFSTRASASSILVFVWGPEKPVLLRMDKDQIHRVLLNLVRNSIEALSFGGVISIDVRKNSPFLEIRLSDTGLGIAKDQLVKIFDCLPVGELSESKTAIQIRFGNPKISSNLVALDQQQ